MFDVCTTGDTAHIDTIFKFLPHTRVNMGASIFFTSAMIRAFRSAVTNFLGDRCRSENDVESNLYFSGTLQYMILVLCNLCSFMVRA